MVDSAADMHADQSHREGSRRGLSLASALLVVVALAALLCPAAATQHAQNQAHARATPIHAFFARTSDARSPSVTTLHTQQTATDAQSQPSVGSSSSGLSAAPLLRAAASQFTHGQSVLQGSYDAFQRVSQSVIAVAKPQLPVRKAKAKSAKDASDRSGSGSGSGGVVVHHRNLASPGGSLQLGSFQLTDAQKAGVRARFGTSSKSLGMRNQSPRWGPSYPDYTADAGEEQDPHGIGISWYLWNVALCAIIGIGIAIGQLLLTGIYFFFRILVWRCCCHKKSEHEEPGFAGYLTFWKKYWPVLFLSIFIALACAFAAVGIIYNNGVSKTFSSTDQENGVGPLALGVMSSLDDWMGAMVAVVGQLTRDVGSIKSPLDGLISDFAGLGTATTGLSTAATQFGSKYDVSNPTYSWLSGFGVVANGSTWYCDATCLAMGRAAATLGLEVQTQVTPTFEEYSFTINDVATSFVNVSDEITSKLGDAQSELDSARGSVISQSNRDLINDNSKMVSDYDVYRNSAFLALFSLVFLSPVLTGLGLASKRGCPFKTTCCCGVFYISIIWLLFGIHWLLGMLIGDACVYLDDSMLDVSSALESQSGGDIFSSVLNACMVNASLITALNLTAQLEFADLITFPEALDTTEIDAAFDLGGFDTMLSQSNLVNVTSFRSASDGYSSFDEAAVVEDNLAAMGAVPTNSLPPSTIAYTRADVLSNHSTAASGFYQLHYSPGTNLNQILALQQTVFEGVEISTSLSAAVATIRAEVALIEGNIVSLRNQLGAVVDSVANTTNPASMRFLLEPVFHAVDTFRDTAYCYDQAAAFGKFKDTFCNQLENNIQWMTFALFIIGLSCWPITWCSRWSSYRIDFVPRIAPAPFDEHAWMVANTASQAQAQYGQNIQLAQMHDEGELPPQETGGMGYEQQHEEQQYQQQQYQQQQQLQQSSYDQQQYTASGTSALGAAVAAPSHEQAMAAYAAQEEPIASPSANNAAAASNDEEQRRVAEQQWQMTEEQQEQQQQHIASPSAVGEEQADAAAASSAPAAEDAAEAAPQSEARKCDSCENEVATVRCQECDETFCAGCDATLHKSIDNAGHNRAII